MDYASYVFNKTSYALNKASSYTLNKIKNILWINNQESKIADNNIAESERREQENGTWTCEACDTVNNNSVNECFCSYPKPNDDNSNKEAEEQWGCLQCSNKNPDNESWCTECGFKKGYKPKNACHKNACHKNACHNINCYDNDVNSRNQDEEKMSEEMKVTPIGPSCINNDDNDNNDNNDDDDLVCKQMNQEYAETAGGPSINNKNNITNNIASTVNHHHNNNNNNNNLVKGSSECRGILAPPLKKPLGRQYGILASPFKKPLRRKYCTLVSPLKTSLKNSGVILAASKQEKIEEFTKNNNRKPEINTLDEELKRQIKESCFYRYGQNNWIY